MLYNIIILESSTFFYVTDDYVTITMTCVMNV